MIKSLVFVYLRLVIIMVLSLITSSYIFRTLGTNDYGIYSVVGGIVVILSFLNHAMIATTQRYLSFNLNDKNEFINIFSISRTIHIAIAVFILIIGETFGLYFINNYLNFPEIRRNAVNIVYQCSLLSVLVMTVNVPYLSIILVKQKISYYAFIGVIEALLKLVLAISLSFLFWDKLIIYSIILLLITILIYSAYYIYAIRKFNFIKNQKTILPFYKMKEMILFSSWNLIGVFAGLGQNVGVNIVLNIYFSLEVNSSRALSYQVYNALNNINTSAQTIYSPLIISKYAASERNYIDYVHFFSKLSFFIILALVLPFYYYASNIIELWLKQVPNYLVMFINLMMIELIILSLSGPLHALIEATGNIKYYQLIVSSLLLLNIPLGIIFFTNSYPPEVIFYISILLTILSLITRIIILRARNLISYKSYIKSVVAPVFFSISLLLILNQLINHDILKIFLMELVIIVFLLNSLLTIDLKFLIEKIKGRFI